MTERPAKLEAGEMIFFPVAGEPYGAAPSEAIVSTTRITAVNPATGEITLSEPPILVNDLTPFTHQVEIKKPATRRKQP